MKLLATLYPCDINPDVPLMDYTVYKPRRAGRAVIFDGNKVALVHITRHGYYMLPGGGIENEPTTVGLAREIKEELGCEVTIEQEVGTTEVYFDRWRRVQTDDCFTANLVGTAGTRTPTDFEQDEGHEVVWAPSLPAAIELLEQSIPDVPDGQIVRARDLIFLRAAGTKLNML